MTTPGWTTARRFCGSTFRILRMRAISITTPALSASAPPESPVPGATRRERHALLCQHAHDRGGLFGRGREDDSARPMLVLRQAVAFVDEQFVGVRQHRIAAHNRAQVFYKFVHVV